MQQRPKGAHRQPPRTEPAQSAVSTSCRLVSCSSSCRCLTRHHPLRCGGALEAFRANCTASFARCVTHHQLANRGFSVYIFGRFRAGSMVRLAVTLIPKEHESFRRVAFDHVSSLASFSDRCRRCCAGGSGGVDAWARFLLAVWRVQADRSRILALPWWSSRTSVKSVFW